MSLPNGEEKKSSSSVIRRASHSLARIFHKRQYSADYTANELSSIFLKGKLANLPHQRHEKPKNCRSQSTSDLPYGKFELPSSVLEIKPPATLSDVFNREFLISSSEQHCSTKRSLAFIDPKVFAANNFDETQPPPFESAKVHFWGQLAVDRCSIKMAAADQKVQNNEQLLLNPPANPKRSNNQQTADNLSSGGKIAGASRRSSVSSSNNAHLGGADSLKVQASPKTGAKKSSAEMMQVENSTKRMTNKERRFHRLFRSVPLDEILLNRFSCAFVSDIGLLIQGHMYVSNDWICFHSNIFGIEKIIEIAVNSIATIDKARTAKIFPNAVIIRTKSAKEYFFASLISRDTTHNVLSDVLAKCQQVKKLNEPCGVAVSQTTTPSPGGQEILLLNSIHTESSMMDNISCSSIDSTDGEDEDCTSQCQTLLINRTCTRQNERKENGGRLQGDRVFTPRDTPVIQTEKNIGQIDLLRKSKSAAKSLVSQLYCSSIFPFVNWFCSLPLLLMVLVVCVVLLVLLLFFAAIATFKIVNIERYDGSLLSLLKSGRKNQWNCQSGHGVETVYSIVQKSIEEMSEIKTHLEAMRSELSKELEIFSGQKQQK